MRRLVVLTASAVVALTTSVVLSSADVARTVTIKGTEGFAPNAFISADFRFEPGPLSVKSGDSVTWQNTTNDGHTISIVPSQPTTIGQVFNCGAPGTVCAPILQCHFPLGFGNGGPPPAVNLTCGNASVGQLKAVGDSFLIPPPFTGAPQTITASITAPPGTTLLYICVIHPWMQGSILVN
jgi:plastocyanin